MTVKKHQAISPAKVRQSDDVADTVRSMIVDFTLPPGSVVSEIQLMRQLGVGRTPVREALLVLAQEFLVKQVPGMGSVVAGLDISDFALVAQCQQAIEPFAARLAAARITVAEVAGLETILARTQTALDGGDLEAVVKANLEFHSAVLTATANHYLADVGMRLQRCAVRFTRFAYERGIPPGRSVEEHQRIVDALSRHMPDEAEERAREHHTNALVRFREALPT
jgi:DNA-binding GntR family transcriptional regulator